MVSYSLTSKASSNYHEALTHHHISGMSCQKRDQEEKWGRRFLGYLRGLPTGHSGGHSDICPNTAQAVQAMYRRDTNALVGKPDLPVTS